MHLTRRQRARIGRTLALVLPAAAVTVLVALADWGRIQRAFFQPDVAADLFPRIVTVGVRNTLLITGIAFVGGPVSYTHLTLPTKA